MGPATEAKAPNFSQPKHFLNAEQPSLSTGSIDYRFPLFHSSNEMRGIVMNASRVRMLFPSPFMQLNAYIASAVM